MPSEVMSAASTAICFCELREVAVVLQDVHVMPAVVYCQLASGVQSCLSTLIMVRPEQVPGPAYSVLLVLLLMESLHVPH